MKLVLSSHNVTLTKAIEDHILAKIDKLEHLDHRAISVRITLENDTAKLTEHRFKCSVRLDVAGPDLYAEDWEVDLYAAIDLVMKKIEQPAFYGLNRLTLAFNPVSDSPDVRQCRRRA